jgi:DNA modification methylase
MSRRETFCMLPSASKRGESAPPVCESDWSNRLACQDNESFLRDALEQLSGRVDLVYVDPPFATGSDFAARVRVGETGREVTVPVYRDRWAHQLPNYLEMLAERFRLVRDLLSDRGSLYVHLDYRAAARVRCLLDDLFGTTSLVNEIVWFYKTGGMPERLGFGRKHDTILFYAKNPAQAIWNPQKEKSYLTHRYGFSNVEIHEDVRGPYTWVNCRDVFDIPALRGNQPERVDFPTQKPQALLERLVLASSQPNSIVADLFCGSGTTLVAAERLGRRWIGCDVSSYAIHTARKRLDAIDARYEVVGDARGEYGVEVSTRRTEGGVQVELTDVRPSIADPLPAAVCRLFQHWSDRVDSWGVQVLGDQLGGTRWNTQRTRQRRSLDLTSAPLPLPEGGRLRVEIADVLGQRASVDVTP